MIQYIFIYYIYLKEHTFEKRFAKARGNPSTFLLFHCKACSVSNSSLPICPNNTNIIRHKRNIWLLGWGLFEIFQYKNVVLIRTWVFSFFTYTLNQFLSNVYP